VNDPSSILIAFVLPVLLLFLYGYGVSLDSTKIKLGFAIEGRTPEVESLLAAFRDSKYFILKVSFFPETAGAGSSGRTDSRIGGSADRFFATTSLEQQRTAYSDHRGRQRTNDGKFRAKLRPRCSRTLAAAEISGDSRPNAGVGEYRKPDVVQPLA